MQACMFIFNSHETIDVISLDIATSYYQEFIIEEITYKLLILHIAKYKI